MFSHPKRAPHLCSLKYGLTSPYCRPEDRWSLLLRHTQFQTKQTSFFQAHLYAAILVWEHIWIGIVYGLFLVNSYTELSVFLTNSHTWCDSEKFYTWKSWNKSSTLISLMLICYIDSAKTTVVSQLPGWSSKPHQEPIPKWNAHQLFLLHCFMQLIEWWRKMEEVGGRGMWHGG